MPHRRDLHVDQRPRLRGVRHLQDVAADEDVEVPLARQRCDVPGDAPVGPRQSSYVLGSQLRRPLVEHVVTHRRPSFAPVRRRDGTLVPLPTLVRWVQGVNAGEPRPRSAGGKRSDSGRQAGAVRVRTSDQRHIHSHHLKGTAMTDLDLAPSPTAGTLPAPGDTGAAVRELLTLLPGRVLLPESPDWDRARLGWTVNVDQHPIAVVTVHDPEDVVAAVRCAVRHGLSVSVQPVGHGATTALSGTVLLRTGALQDLTIDVERRVARVGAGVKWGTLLAALEPTGLMALAGSSPDPSVVGFTLGGGLSWFSRALGLTAHSVVAFEIVDAEGVQRRVAPATDPDLFWAMCGGGGDFGVVLAVEIMLDRVGPIVGGRMLWPLEMARPVLRAFRQITADAPDELTLWAHLFRFPPMPQLPELLRGRSFVSVDLTFLGSETEADRLISRLRQLPAQVVDTVGVVPLSQLGGIAAEPVDPMPTQEYAELLARPRRRHGGPARRRRGGRRGPPAHRRADPSPRRRARPGDDGRRTQRADRRGVHRVLPRGPGGTGHAGGDRGGLRRGAYGAGRAAQRSDVLQLPGRGVRPRVHASPPRLAPACAR